MKYSFLVLCLFISACSATPAAPLTPTRATETVLPSTPSTSSTPAPTIAAIAPTPSAISTPVISARAITITTDDGASLQGTLYGNGMTAVIFSHMGAHKQETWATMARVVAAQGYLAITYDMRFWVNGAIKNELQVRAPDDLRAVVAFARQQGAQRIVLVGASLGGMATAKVAGATRATAIVILAAPMSVEGFALRVEEAELQAIAAPKLFITTENDAVVAAAQTRRMYDAAPQPKEWQTYTGTAHGTEIFDTVTGAELQRRILSFIASVQ